MEIEAFHFGHAMWTTLVEKLPEDEREVLRIITQQPPTLAKNAMLELIMRRLKILPADMRPVGARYVVDGVLVFAAK